jgi:Xaa-Pro aminopeptidase
LYFFKTHILSFFNTKALSGQLLIVCLFFFMSLRSQGQDYRYDNDLLSKEFHKSRRQALRELLPEGSVAIFFSSSQLTRSNDVEYPFHQDPDFYYLSGCLEPEAVLMIFKEKQKLGENYADEIIFIQGRDPSREIWTGPLLGVEGAKKFLGFEAPRINSDFKDVEFSFNKFKTIFYKRSDEMGSGKSCENHPFWNVFSSKASLSTASNINNKGLRTFMAALREVKSDEELKLIRNAIDITNMAHISLMSTLKPGMTEYQSQAQIEFIFKKSGCESAAFPSIVGGGKNSCILHYETNRKTLLDSELLVVDIGAEYHGYAADITRTLPVNGKFTAEQKKIYELVFAAQEAGIRACLAGNEFGEPGKQAKNIIAKGLMDLGIIQKETDHSIYFMHGTSHYLGLDVHDIGTYGKLSAGNIITVEPGIYIPEGSDCDRKWWNIGIRIEDDILITSKVPLNLSEKAPRTVEEIEKMMSQAPSGK